MVDRTPIDVPLTPELAKFIEAEVASGRCRSAGEVIVEGLRLLREREEKRRAAIDAARREVGRGLEAAKCDDLVGGTEALREAFEERRRRRAAGSR